LAFAARANIYAQGRRKPIAGALFIGFYPGRYIGLFYLGDGEAGCGIPAAGQIVLGLSQAGKEA
jgi:hypothetical protein